MRWASFLPTPRRLLDRRPVLQGDGVGEVLRRQRAEHGQRHLGADALDGLQRAEPGALDLAGEAEQADGVLAHVRLDGEAHGLAGLQRAQRARRGLHLVAHAADVDDGVRLAHRVDDPLELADHGATSLSPLALGPTAARQAHRWRSRGQTGEGRGRGSGLLWRL